MFRSTAIALAATALLAAPAWAQKASSDHSAHHGAAMGASAPLADGEIRKIDKAAKKITIKHGRIANIDMDAMTMVFAVKDPALLDKAKPGQKVKFQAEMVNGVATVTQIEAPK
ncbi:MAG: copper-binding protein [Burkholderiales bacterium]|nr:copper-binding protein [Burkholderiales bacterium]